MAYKATITIDDLEQTDARGAAEGAYFELLLSLFYRGCEFEVTDKETGKSTIINLDADLENDQSMLRHMALMQIFSRLMTDQQKAELQEWEHENLDGHSVSTADWPGWAEIIGHEKPRKFQLGLVENSENPNGKPY
jgi:hypothetical protein